MPKRKVRGESQQGEGKEPGSRQRSKTVLAVFKTKLCRHRSSSVDAEPDKLSVRAKCATLPARVNSDRNKPRTLKWMEDMLGALEDTLPNRITVTRKDSDESVDSGFHQVPKVDGSESDPNNSPSQSKIVVSQVEANGYARAHLEPRYSMYDYHAVEKAFGPMKDIGRWYSTYSSHYVPQPRVVRPDRLDELSDEEDERLASRPLPPIPPEPAAPGAVRPVPEYDIVKGDPVYENEGGGVYERVEQQRLRGSKGLMLGLRNLARHGWYWGPITRVEAEEKLQGTDNGTFLVRDSSDERYLLSLSFRSQGKTLHTRIEYSNGHFSFYSFPDSESEGYRSVVELIEHSMEYSREGVFCFSRARALGSPAVPVRLLKPLSRFYQVRSLQHYCRFVIRQSIRFDMIRHLPLPRHVHGYLEQSQF